MGESTMLVYAVREWHSDLRSTFSRGLGRNAAAAHKKKSHPAVTRRCQGREEPIIFSDNVPRREHIIGRE